MECNDNQHHNISATSNHTPGNWRCKKNSGVMILSPCKLRSIHTKGFAPGLCPKGTLLEQSSSVCPNDFMGIIHPWEQNFRPAKCSTINRLNIWEQVPGEN